MLLRTQLLFFMRQHLLRMSMIVVLYALLAMLALRFFAIASGNVSLVWPSSGLALAALLVGGRRYAWAVLLGAFATNTLQGSPLHTALLIGIGATLSALTAQQLLSNNKFFDPALQRPRDYFSLMAAAALSALVSATVGVVALWSAGIIPIAAGPQALLNWWQGDTLGMLLVTPLILVWQRCPKRWFSNMSRTLETLACFGLLLLSGQMEFLDTFSPFVGAVEHLHPTFLFVVWAAVRFGRRGVTLVIVLTAIQALIGAAHGTGVFDHDFEQTHMLSFWLYALTLSTVGISMALSIAHRRQVEVKLKQSEAFKDVILNSVAAEIVVIDNQGIILAVNEHWRQFALNNSAEPGQPAANTGIGSNYMSVCAVDAATDQHSQEACQGIFDVLQGRRTSFTLEYPCHSPAKKRWFNMIVMPLRFNAQDGATITHTDITQVKQVQEDLRESYVAIHSILDTTLDGYWRTDLQGRLREVNASYCRMSGYSRDELLGLSISDLEDIENPKDMIARMDRLLRTGHDQFETQHRRKDGSVWQAEVSTTFNGQIATPSCFVFCRDITERKALQQSLLDQERQRFEQLDKLTAAVPGVVYQFKVEPGGSWAFIYVSAAIESLFELRPQDAYQNPDAMTHCIVEEDRVAHRASVERSFKAVTPWSHEHRIQTKSGCLKWIRGQALPELQADGSVIWQGILTDITAAKQAEEKMRQSESHLRAVFDSALDAIIGMDDQGRITEWNKRAETTFGWHQKEAVGLNLHDVIAPTQHRAAHQSGMAHFLATGQSTILNRRIEINALRRSGEEFPVELSILPFKTAGGYQFTAFLADISERKAQETQLQDITARLRASEAHYRLLTENVSDVVWRQDRGHCFTYISPADERLRGYRADEVIGRHAFELMTDEGIALVAEITQRLKTSPPNDNNLQGVTFEAQQRCKDGSLVWTEIVSVPELNSQGEVIGHHGISRDITERKRMQEEVRQLAYFDPLTRLPNRRLLNDRLHQTLAASKRTGRFGAMMVLDLDNFKPLNDQHGHLVGDLLLVEVAKRLLACVREMDTVARFGGDEFVVMLSELDEDQAESHRQAQAVAEKIRQTLAVSYVLRVSQENQAPSKVEHHCTASIGVALFANHDVRSENILQWADAAMYQAKDAGRNVIRFHTVG
ncbi:MAG: PAS domain S-box protein [Comamonadaceae bacterium]|nr:PAS domain S-box protein [Comamonadaceae bacterium]